ncbi:MAG TPA: hypothetical protein PKA06_07465, partial [Gemmatales bacterium]|nr:hypothetical protein [Gemmatales bacterium]
MFVMAIGMISLLALFPVAFHNARWALDNEQVARGAANAQAISELPRVTVRPDNVVTSIAQSVRNDQYYKPSLSNPSLCWRCAAPLDAVLGRRDFLINMVDGFWTFNSNILVAPPNEIPNARVKLPPVLVDPLVAEDPTFVDPVSGLPFHVGLDNLATAPFRSNGGNSQVFNTAAALRPSWSVGIPRVSSSQYQLDPDPNGLRKQTEISMGDEIEFGPNGQPLLNPSTLVYARQRRFTWAYMCHWPDYQNTDVCEVTAVVFNSRPTNSGLATLPPGEATFIGHPVAAVNAGIEAATLPDNVGRVFRKGLTQAGVYLGTSATPLPLKVNDWILDSTMILPEYDFNHPQLQVPFLDEYHRDASYTFTLPGPTTVELRPGLVGGHFYKVVDISEVRNVGGVFFQTITLDRPARSDGFSVTIL